MFNFKHISLERKGSLFNMSHHFFFFSRRQEVMSLPGQLTTTHPRGANVSGFTALPISIHLNCFIVHFTTFSHSEKGQKKEKKNLVAKISLQ